MKLYATRPGAVPDPLEIPDTIEIEKTDTVKELQEALRTLPRHSAMMIKTMIWNRRTGPSKRLALKCTLPSLERVIFCPGTRDVGAYAFEHCGHLKTVVFPEGLKCIKYKAFAHSGLTEAVLPKSISTIEFMAFSCCTKLASITIPADAPLADLPEYFAECTAIAEFTCPNSLRTLGTAAFSHCHALRSITLNEGLREIGNYAFRDTAITDLHLPSTFRIAAFLHCPTSLRKLSVAKASPYSCIDGFLVDDNGYLLACLPAEALKTPLCIPEGVRGIHPYFKNQLETVRCIKLPDTYDTFAVRDAHLQDIVAADLNTIDVSPSNPRYTSINGILYSKDGTALVFRPPAHEDTCLVVPETVKELAPCALQNAHLQSLLFRGDIMLNENALVTARIEHCTFTGCVFVRASEQPVAFAKIRELEFRRSVPAYFASRLTVIDVVFYAAGHAVHHAFEEMIKKPVFCEI